MTLPLEVELTRFERAFPHEPGTVTFAAFGRPVPQGTVRSLGKGRPSIHGNAQTLLPWRATIALAAAEGAELLTWARTEQPVTVHARFFFDRPLGHFGKKGLRPAAPAVPYGRGVGDIDKLCRGLLDAIGDSGAVWLDDSQVVELLATKQYVAPHTSLDRPGVIVVIRPVRS